MKIDQPFSGSRQRALNRYYHVQPRYEQPVEVTGATLRRLFLWGSVAVFFVWWLFS